MLIHTLERVEYGEGVCEVDAVDDDVEEPEDPGAAQQHQQHTHTLHVRHHNTPSKKQEIWNCV